MKDLVKNRRSVRAYDGREISSEDKAKLCEFMENIENPYGINVEFKLMDADEHGLKCPVVVGTDLYVGGKIKRAPSAFEAFGYSFEMLVLDAKSLGIGTVWLGGTMNRPAYEAAMELSEDEMMPCASPLGYPAKKMSLRESMMRKAIKADERLPFEELFFDGSFDAPLTEEKAAELAYPLEMVRCAPSAVNKQPWRAVVSGNAVHFYLKRSSGDVGGDVKTQASPPCAKFEPYKGKKRKPGTGYVKQLSANCWQGRYSPTVNGERVVRNIYAETEAEFEKALAELIHEMQAELGRA